MLSSKLSVGVHILAVLGFDQGEPVRSELLGGSVNIQGILTEVYDEVHKGVADRLARLTIAAVVNKLKKQMNA
jgi:hypothetical protein